MKRRTSRRTKHPFATALLTRSVFICKHGIAHSILISALQFLYTTQLLSLFSSTSTPAARLHAQTAPVELPHPHTCTVAREPLRASASAMQHFFFFSAPAARLRSTQRYCVVANTVAFSELFKMDRCNANNLPILLFLIISLALPFVFLRLPSSARLVRCLLQSTSYAKIILNRLLSHVSLCLALLQRQHGFRRLTRCVSTKHDPCSGFHPPSQ